jgi:L-iditol 2-dehydrogenase
MKQVAITGPKTAALLDVPDPSPKENWVVVRITVAPMCTEYKMWVGGHKADFLGHEAVGEVVGVAQPGRVKIGDRVVVQPSYPCGACTLCIAGDYIHCEHGVDLAAFTGSPYGTATYAEYLIKPDWLCSPIPDDFTDDQAGLALCALGPSFGAFETAGVTAFHTVLICGLGPVGLGGVVNAVYRGARVIGVESNAYRAALALRLGAEAVLDPGLEDLGARIRDLTDGRGVDVGLDCSGSTAAHRVLIDAAARKGAVMFVGESNGDTIVHISPDMIRKGLRLVGSWHYNRSLYPRLLQVIRRSCAAGELVTHTFPLANVQEAFSTLAGQQTGKVLLRP